MLRGYDIKQVNEYIFQICFATNKNAGELSDQRYEELKNAKQMLEYELSQSKGQVEKLTKLLEDIRVQRDTLQHKRAVKVKTLTPLKLRNIRSKNKFSYLKKSPFR